MNTEPNPTHPNPTGAGAPWTDLLEPRTYLKIAYLLLGFPLGLTYFVVLVTGLALGLGLSITLLGIPLLMVVIGFVWSFVWLEREAAALVLGLKPEYEPKTPSSTQDDSETPSETQNSAFAQSWNSLWAYLSSGEFWRGLAHLLLRFPIGLFGFLVTVVLLSVSAALIGTPFYFNHADWSLGWDGWHPNLLEALCLSAVGLGLGLISLRVLNLLAEAMARMTYSLLGDARPPEPVARHNPVPNPQSDAPTDAPTDRDGR